jgi:hypothetical protein
MTLRHPQQHHLLLIGQGGPQGEPPPFSRRKLRHGVFIGHQRCLLVAEESFKRTERLFLKGMIDHPVQLLAGRQEGNAGFGVPAPCALKVPASLAERDQTNKTGRIPIIVIPLP